VYIAGVFVAGAGGSCAENTLIGMALERALSGAGFFLFLPASVLAL